MILLQNAVRGISYLRMVETLNEFQSTTQGHGKSTNIKYEIYYELLINACVRHDKTHKANLGKRGIIYSTFTQNAENTPNDDSFSSENLWESSSKALLHLLMSSRMSTQTHHTYQSLVGIKTPLDFYQKPQITL